MANQLDVLLPKIISHGRIHLQENCVMPRMVNQDVSDVQVEYGDSVTVTISRRVSDRPVVPGVTTPISEDIIRDKVTVKLDQYKESNFSLTRKEKNDFLEKNVFPDEAKENVNAVVRGANQYLFNLYKDCYNVSGTPGTIPFASDISAATDAQQKLTELLCPVDDRQIVLGTTEHYNLFNVRTVTDASYVGNKENLANTTITNKLLGFDNWVMDQSAPYHTSGTGAAIEVVGVNAIGETSVAVDSVSGGTLVHGDIIYFDGDDQSYVVKEDIADVSSATIVIDPPLKKATTVDQPVTVLASHRVNLAFRKNAILFVSRALDGYSELSGDHDSARSITMFDDLTGLNLNFSTFLDYKMRTYSFDLLYAAKIIKQDFIVRLVG